jgi:hypothetical protein
MMPTNLKEFAEVYPEWFATPNCGYEILPPEWERLVVIALGLIANKYHRWIEVGTIRDRLIAEGDFLLSKYDWIRKYFEENPVNPWIGFHINQLKEKFGGLRFYWSFSGTDKKAWSFIDGVTCFAECAAQRISLEDT